MNSKRQDGKGKDSPQVSEHRSYGKKMQEKLEKRRQVKFEITGSDSPSKKPGSRATRRDRG